MEHFSPLHFMLSEDSIFVNVIRCKLKPPTMKSRNELIKIVSYPRKNNERSVKVKCFSTLLNRQENCQHFLEYLQPHCQVVKTDPISIFFIR
ncbi:CLUMA_CG003911, isoform A [Clunio marinus]|uniref:CLUMA_CG003911, isoform A n=1 Tax=Clunio marinus TaxID=568069 RepID=A0A1J1HQ76_9DIPT|nr:CLUMA_CG003911, isoform A [Clunio marinus]